MGQNSFECVYILLFIYDDISNSKAATGVFLGDLDKHLASVLALEQLHKSFRCALDAMDNRLAALKLALLDPLRHILNSLAVLLGIVKHNKALHPCTLSDQRTVVGYYKQVMRRTLAMILTGHWTTDVNKIQLALFTWSLRGGIVVGANGTTNNDATLEGNASQASIQNVSASVIEKDVNQLGGNGAEVLKEGL